MVQLKEQVAVLQKQMDAMNIQHATILNLPFDWKSRMGWFKFRGSNSATFIFKCYNGFTILLRNEHTENKEIVTRLYCSNGKEKRRETGWTAIYTSTMITHGECNFKKFPSLSAEKIWGRFSWDANELPLLQIPMYVLEMANQFKETKLVWKSLKH